MAMEHTTRIREQEDNDFKVASAVMRMLFSGVTLNIRQETYGSHTDMRMTAYTRNGDVKYNIEIKSKRDVETYEEVPLRIAKYLYMKESTRSDERLIYIILSNGYYHIFNLDSIDLNKVKMRNWNIKDTEYDSRSMKSVHPCMFIPLSMQNCTGIIPRKIMIEDADD